MDSDHYLVAAKVRTRITSMKKSVTSTRRKFAIEKLQTPQTAEAFANQVTTLLAENPPLSNDVDLLWNSISHCMRTAAQDVLGYYRPQRNSWFDQECRAAAAAKDTAYKKHCSLWLRRNDSLKGRSVKLKRENLRILR